MPGKDEAAVFGLILAGGRALRLGGGDKSLRLMDRRPILAHVIERFHPQCAHLALNANGAPERFASFGLSVIADAAQDYAGPLAGVVAGLDLARLNSAAPHSRAACLATIPADAPFLPPDLVGRLKIALEEQEADIAMARSGAQTHYLAALWRLAVRDDLCAALAQGVRKVSAVASLFKVAIVDWPSAPIDPFFNINTPEDLQQARLLLRALA